MFFYHRVIDKLFKIHPDLINSKKEDGFTGFHLAALNGHLSVINYLVKNKMDIEIRNNSKQTSLMIAVAKLHIPIIDFLIEHSKYIKILFKKCPLFWRRKGESWERTNSLKNKFLYFH